jgi:hypothetical protein
MDDYVELLIGCGHARRKVVIAPGSSSEWRGLVTLDDNENCAPDILCNLDRTPWNPPCVGPSVPRALLDDEMLYIAESSVNEIHAYEVLEHLGSQGSTSSFFGHFHELWRVLKPNGYLCATVPSRFSPWLWGDPGHRRAILQETLTFLDQTSYTAQIGRTAMSDYRSIWHGDFSIVYTHDDRVFHTFILQAIKPSRAGSTDGGLFA